MNFCELKNFNWQAIASLLTAIAVGIALSSIIINNRKARRREKHLLGEFVWRMRLLLIRVEAIIKTYGVEGVDRAKYRITVADMPNLRNRVEYLHAFFHDQGHLITDKTKYNFIRFATMSTRSISEATTVALSTLENIQGDINRTINRVE